jgi:hypothetical protein
LNRPKTKNHKLSQLKYIAKIIWVLNNFLRMEFYRKLCNKLYWKKLQPGTLPYTTRCWLIIISALSAVWLAFFFDPVDPTNSNSPSNLITQFSRYFRKLESSLFSLIHTSKNFYNKFCFHVSISFNYIDNVFLRQSQETYLKTSAIRI